jgi:perosamine synthetase
MTEPSAIVALDLLEHLDDLVIRREVVADVYAAGIADNPSLISQEVTPGNRHAWVHWTLRIGAPLDRDRVAGHLTGLGVETKPYYWPLLHLTDRSAPAAALPVTETIGREVLALPMSSEMTIDDAERVVMALDIATGRW